MDAWMGDGRRMMDDGWLKYGWLVGLLIDGWMAGWMDGLDVCIMMYDVWM